MQYSKIFEVRWADLDPNFHMRNTAYSDYTAHTRFSYLKENGFSLHKFKEIGIGPVIFSEKIEYFKEVGPDQKITVNTQVSGLSKDGRKWRFRHQIFREDGKEAARVTTDGAWFSLSTRKLQAPPAELIEVVLRVEKASDFIDIE
jgi:acyl-CoA thioester hydrolase